MENPSPHYKLHISVVIFSFLTMIISWTLLFSYLEWWNYVQSFYFAVTTTTTVWYGDLIPSNDTTRLAVAIYILFSVTLYISTAAVLGNWYLEKFSRKRETILQKYSEMLDNYHIKRKKK